ncbi:MAG TPA: Npt1/Npt2 family nucleotide transporter [Vicinamibacterales bacterium]|nr:Npt1/Npt2 family nucleotide transporter [Vicinamibacterales bacterium]
MFILVQRVLGLTPRELARALPLFAYLFLTMAGSVVSKAARDALFLDRFAATDLPYVDIAIALIVGLVAGVYIRAGSRTNLRNLQVGSLLTFAASAVLFWWLSARDADGGSNALFIAIYIWVGAMSVLVPTQVWTLANYLMTTREAKRAFGLIGGGAILGWIVGGLATREIVARFGTESTLLWVAGTLTVSAGIVAGIWRSRPVRAGGDGPAAGEGEEGSLWSSLSMVRGSSYLTAIASVIWLAAFVTTIAGWQFKAIAKANIPSTDELAIFFGAFNMLAGLIALALQVLFTGRVLRSAGIGVALFIVPVALSVSSLGVIILGSLLAASAMKASDQVLRYSIDKATVELLYLPVPANVTFRVKAFIDTVVYRMGDALGGLAILLFAVVLGLSPIQMSWIALLALLGWLWAALIARFQYVENLRESIHQHRVDTERASGSVLDEKSASDLIVSQLDGSPAEVLYALHLFESSHQRAVHPAVRGLVHHEATEVRAQAVKLLARAGDPSMSTAIERMLYDPHFEVRTEALLYLTQHAHVDPLERIEQLGDFPDFSLRAAMAAFLARPGRAQNIEAARAIVVAMVAETGEEGRRTRLEAAQLLGSVPDIFDKELRVLLQDPDPEVAAASIRAVGRLRKRTLVPRVIERLAQPGITDVAVAVFAGMGDTISGTLRDYLVDPTTPIEIRREIPAALQAIGTPAAQYVLLESVLDSDTLLRHRIITALNKLGQVYPERRIDRRLIETVLGAEIMSHYRSYQVLGSLGASLDVQHNPVVQGLTESIQQEAERIFRLLKILYPEHDMHSAYIGLQAEDPVVQDNAMEFLETVVSAQLRALIVPLFDRGVSIGQRGHLANRLLGASLGDREEAISVMMLSHDPWLQSCAAYAIGEFRLSRFAAQLDEWSTHADPLLRATAVDAARKLRA